MGHAWLFLPGPWTPAADLGSFNRMKISHPVGPSFYSHPRDNACPKRCWKYLNVIFAIGKLTDCHTVVAIHTRAKENYNHQFISKANQSNSGVGQVGTDQIILARRFRVRGKGLELSDCAVSNFVPLLHRTEVGMRVPCR